MPAYYMQLYIVQVLHCFIQINKIKSTRCGIAVTGSLYHMEKFAMAKTRQLIKWSFILYRFCTVLYLSLYVLHSNRMEKLADA
jgi:hypothetical protein